MTTMTSTPAIASAASVSVDYVLEDSLVRALDDADLIVQPGEVLAVVGESGSGKSTLARALGGALPGNADVVAGDLTLTGQHLRALSAEQLRAIHAHDVAFIDQDPLAALDPTARIATQLRRALPGRSQDELVELLESVSMRDPERVLRAYPGELSGGMAQRVCIAMAVAREPDLLIADEPTAALDASIKVEVLDLLMAWARRTQAAILLLSHDLHLVREHADRVAVMYGGRVVEIGPARAVLDEPQHPYTQALVKSLPAHADLGQTIEPIPGRPPTLREPSVGCAFAPRCQRAVSTCATQRPQPQEIDGHVVLCPVVVGVPERSGS